MTEHACQQDFFPQTCSKTNSPQRGFPGGPVVTNSPFNAGDLGLIPGLGTKISHATGQLSPHASTELAHSKARVLQLEKSLHAAAKIPHAVTDPTQTHTQIITKHFLKAPQRTLMARPGSNFCLRNLQGWHHTIGTKKDYYEMGRGADDSPREWILEVEKAQVHRAHDCLLPSLFSWMRKVAAQRWQVPYPKSHSQCVGKPG